MRKGGGKTEWGTVYELGTEGVTETEWENNGYNVGWVGGGERERVQGVQRVCLLYT